jgi:hypothetical protein
MDLKVRSYCGILRYSMALLLKALDPFKAEDKGLLDLVN